MDKVELRTCDVANIAQCSPNPERVIALGQQIRRGYTHTTTVYLIGVLQGVCIFLANLIRHINFTGDCRFYWGFELWKTHAPVGCASSVRFR
jgi:hypothetical protein